ncbi:MAG: radical SAM family heme chaperone HemW [Pseudomonadota bacterium]
MRPLGLYVHWPFCQRLCPYCDFTIAKAREVDAAAWARALTDDLRRMAALYEPRRLASVYFGGGTPSLMPRSVAAAVIDEAEALFGFEEDAEFTIEANPDDSKRFGVLKTLGFQRLSLGVQSLDDDELRFLGRNHDADAAQRAVDEALMLFPRVSLDFIYALPEQAAGDWEERLRVICGLGATHFSLYQLTVEPQTAFGRAAKRGTLVPMPDDNAADLYEVTQSVTEAAGFPAYETSSHAVPGHEARHNALYWDDADWVGIGPGAAGRWGPAGARFAAEGEKQPVTYPNLPAADRISVSTLTEHDHWLEVLGGGLRPTSGLKLSRLGVAADAVLDAAWGLACDGLVTADEERLVVTARGRLLTDYIAARLASALPESASGAA